MKTRSLVLTALLSAAICLLALQRAVLAADTNSEPAGAIVANTAPAAPVILPELTELRAQLDSISRANEAASGKWDSLIDQNSSLSNVLADLKTALATQQKREAELGEQARAFNMKVMAAAGGAIFLVFLASYWFQLRCLNRVMEFSRTIPALNAPPSPALLEMQGERESKLLEAVRVLENRIQQLEAPPAPPAAAAAPAPAPAPAPAQANDQNAADREAVIIHATPVPAPEAPQTTNSKVSLLLAKGEILLDMERLQEAVSCFNEALAADPGNAEAHLKKGIALERMNRLELSLSSYEEALRLNPKRSFAYVHKARVLAALHRYDEALSVYDSALGKNGGKPSASNLVNGY